MLKRLQKSFVAITMASAALVLVLLMGIVNLVSAAERNRSDAEILTYLAENDGQFPELFAEMQTASDEADYEPSGEPSDEPSDLREFGGKGGKRGGGRYITEETPYETRYFTVLLTGEDQVLRVDTKQIASVTAEEAAAIAAQLQSEGRTEGRYRSFRYTTVGTFGGTLYIFLDCTKTLSAGRSFLLTSVIVTAAGLAALFFVAWLLSGRAVRPIAESYAKQKTFITNAGHELKTPLAVIESSTEVLELETGENQWTRSIHKQVERMTDLTRDLIALSRMDEDGQRLDLTDTDASAVVAEALEPYAALAEQAGKRLTAEIAPGLTLRADRAALEKLCVLLADNAVKYAAPGGEIRFRLARDGKRVLLRGENPAEGLTPGEQEAVFDRFYRGDASRSETPGYGLGLPMARQLAEAMGGRIRAESPDGKRFVITAQFPAPG